MSEAKNFSLHLHNEFTIRCKVSPKDFQEPKTWTKLLVQSNDSNSKLVKQFSAIPFNQRRLCSFPHFDIDYTVAKTIHIIRNMRELAFINEDTMWGIDNSFHLVSPNQTRSLLNDNIYGQIWCAKEIN